MYIRVLRFSNETIGNASNKQSIHQDSSHVFIYLKKSSHFLDDR